MRGGAPRVVWFSSESDPHIFSARSVAADLVREGNPAHLVWNPCSGEIVQLIPITRAGGLLDGPARHEGRTCVQVMVVGHARDPFTGTLLTGLEVIMAWLDAWGIGRRWPAGPPLPPPQSYAAARARRDWARGGHFGASQVPGPLRFDPGGIDIRRITGPDTPVTAVPRQRPIPAQETGPGPDAPREAPRTVPADPLPLQPAMEPAAAGAGAGGARLAVPLPRAADPDGYRAGNGRPAAPPAPPPTPQRPVPEPASLRS
ncbi:hypothetical protein [Spirillospora sp. NPDC029432]|uniref:hypothetical protein n=1 Tax=Spirillospora sp. NPDC029432 TaxID=3154599 RepID=UPI003454720E